MVLPTQNADEEVQRELERTKIFKSINCAKTNSDIVNGEDSSDIVIFSSIFFDIDIHGKTPYQMCKLSQYQVNAQ